MADLYISDQGSNLQRSGNSLVVKNRHSYAYDLHSIDSIHIIGRIQLGAQVLAKAKEHGIPVAFYSLLGEPLCIMPWALTKRIFSDRQPAIKPDADFAYALDRELFGLRFANGLFLIEKHLGNRLPQTQDDFNRHIEESIAKKPDTSAERSIERNIKENTATKQSIEAHTYSNLSGFRMSQHETLRRRFAYSEKQNGLAIKASAKAQTKVNIKASIKTLRQIQKQVNSCSNKKSLLELEKKYNQIYYRLLMPSISADSRAINFFHTLARWIASLVNFRMDWLISASGLNPRLESFPWEHLNLGNKLLLPFMPLFADRIACQAIQLSIFSPTDFIWHKTKSALKPRAIGRLLQVYDHEIHHSRDYRLVRGDFQRLAAGILTWYQKCLQNKCVLPFGLDEK